jgi:predicted membrane protein
MLNSGKNRKLVLLFVPMTAMRRSYEQLQEVFKRVSIFVYFDPAKLIHFKTDSMSYAIVEIILQQADNVCDSTDHTRRSKGKEQRQKSLVPGCPLFEQHGPCQGELHLRP